MHPFAAGGLVFGASAAILVLEILAVRLLAPFLGVTLETTTGIIGTVLAGIALGTWLGGRLADRVDPAKLLGPLLVAGGALALGVIPIVGVAANIGLSADPLGILMFAGLAFFAPAAVLSAVSPTVVKTQLRDLDETGTIVGRYSALGTSGAIIGTFVTGFVLVSALPTRPIIIVLGITLVLAGLLVSVTLGRTRVVGPAVLAVALLGLSVAWVVAGPDRCERESAYFCISVEEDEVRTGGRLLLMDSLRHAYVDLDDPTYLRFSYTSLLGDISDSLAPEGQAIDALHIGGGGFTLPRYIEATRPTSFNRVLELDPVVLQTAREELGLVTGPALEVAIGDGRLSVRDEPSDRYDLVIGDAFAGPAVPWHLTTREFLNDIQRVLRDDGVYAANIIDYQPLDLARAELATFAEVFDHIAVVGAPGRLSGQTGGNIILVASDAPIDAAAILARIRDRGAGDIAEADRTVLDEFIDDAPVLTDDFAPTDQLLTRFG
jgi:MFS family permease